MSHAKGQTFLLGEWVCACKGLQFVACIRGSGGDVDAGHPWWVEWLKGEANRRRLEKEICGVRAGRDHVLRMFSVEAHRWPPRIQLTEGSSAVRVTHTTQSQFKTNLEMSKHRTGPNSVEIKPTL